MAGSSAMFVTLGEFRSTHVAPINATPGVYDPPGPYSEFVVFASTDTMLKLCDASSPAPASNADFLLVAGCYARLQMDDGYTLSWVAADTAPDGEIRITEASLP